MITLRPTLTFVGEQIDVSQLEAVLGLKATRLRLAYEVPGAGSRSSWSYTWPDESSRALDLGSINAIRYLSERAADIRHSLEFVRALTTAHIRVEITAGADPGDDFVMEVSPSVSAVLASANITLLVIAIVEQ